MASIYVNRIQFTIETISQGTEISNLLISNCIFPHLFDTSYNSNNDKLIRYREWKKNGTSDISYQRFIGMCLLNL